MPVDNQNCPPWRFSFNSVWKWKMSVYKNKLLLEIDLLLWLWLLAACPASLFFPLACFFFFLAVIFVIQCVLLSHAGKTDTHSHQHQRAVYAQKPTTRSKKKKKNENTSKIIHILINGIKCIAGRTGRYLVKWVRSWKTQIALVLPMCPGPGADWWWKTTENGHVRCATIPIELIIALRIATLFYRH